MTNLLSLFPVCSKKLFENFLYCHYSLNGFLCCRHWTILCLKRLVMARHIKWLIYSRWWKLKNAALIGKKNISIYFLRFFRRCWLETTIVARNTLIFPPTRKVFLYLKLYSSFALTWFGKSKSVNRREFSPYNNFFSVTPLPVPWAQKHCKLETYLRVILSISSSLSGDTISRSNDTNPQVTLRNCCRFEISFHKDRKSKNICITNLESASLSKNLW